MNMKNTELAFCKFSKYPILKSIRVKFSRYKQKSMNVSVSFDTLILIYKKRKYPRLFADSTSAFEKGLLMCVLSVFFHIIIPDNLIII